MNGAKAMAGEKLSATSNLSGITISAPRRRRRWAFLFGLQLFTIIFVWALNYALVQRAVSQALYSDARNSGYSMCGHYRYYVDPSTLVLDLREVSAASPLDLFRGLFESAAALAAEGRTFHRVILARTGTPVFIMSGDDFHELGTEFGEGQNPIYLLRTLPEKLYNPAGDAAFGHWEGGFLGVITKQMEDVTEAGRRWGGAS